MKSVKKVRERKFSNRDEFTDEIVKGNFDKSKTTTVKKTGSTDCTAKDSRSSVVSSEGSQSFVEAIQLVDPVR